MSTTHDFGAGSVPAHRHANGGGWVADSARVDASAYVGPDARVSGTAQVYGTAQVSGTAQVYGTARVSGTALVSGNARVYGDAKTTLQQILSALGACEQAQTWADEQPEDRTLAQHLAACPSPEWRAWLARRGIGGES